jgi:branched-chain amino acid aminotransferase
MREPLVYLDGAFVPGSKAGVPLGRVDALAAIALAENLPVRAAKPEYLTAHLRRLKEGCRAMAWPDPDLKLMAKVARDLPRRNRVISGSLRLRWWGGLTEPLLLAQTLPARPAPRGGIRLITSAVRHYGADSLNARAKVAHMLPNWLAKAEAEAWAEDGLRLTPDGCVAEGIWSNLVAVKGKLARTPPLHQGVLEGVTRAQLLKRLGRRGLIVREVPLTRYDLWTADEVWVTSSLRGALRVASVDGRQLK